MLMEPFINSGLCEYAMENRVTHANCVQNLRKCSSVKIFHQAIINLSDDRHTDEFINGYLFPEDILFVWLIVFDGTKNMNDNRKHIIY